MEDSTLKARSNPSDSFHKILTAVRCTSLLICSLPLLFVMTFTFPKFAPIFEKVAARSELPTLTAVFLSIRQFCINYYGLPVITAFLLLIGVDYYCSNPKFRSAKWFPWILFATLTVTAIIMYYLAFYSLMLPVYAMGNVVGEP